MKRPTHPAARRGHEPSGGAWSESAFRYLFANNPRPMWVYDLETLAFLEVNEAAVAQYGYSHDEFMQMTIRDIRPPEELSRLDSNLAQIHPPQERSGPWKHRRKDGKLIDVEVTSHQFEIAGRKARLVSVDDITERKRAEERLRTSDEILQRMNNLVIVQDEDGLLTYINSAAARLVEYSPEELLGDGWWRLTRDPEAAQQDQELVKHRARGITQITEQPYIHPLRTRSGEIRTIQWQDAIGPGKTIIGVGQDITERMQAEETLRQAQARTEDVLANVADLYILLDREWHYLYVNAASVQAMGLPREEILRHTLWELYPDILGTELERGYRRCMEERVPTNVEFHYPAVDTWWDNHFYPAAEGLAVFATDITERKRAEEKLRVNEDRYRDLVENSHDLICTHDLQGNLLSVNSYPGEILGYTTEQLLQMNLRDILTPEARAGFRPYLKDIEQNGIAKGDMHVMTRSGDVRIWEYRNTLRTEGVATPVVRGMARDVTEQRRAEAQLQQSERDLAEAQRIARLGSWSREEPSGAVRWSDEVYEIFGLERGAPIDFQTFISRVHPEDVALVEQSSSRALEIGDDFYYEFRIVLDGGQVKTIAETGHAVRDANGRITGLFGTTQDITERKQAEEQLRYDATVLANISDAIIATDANYRITAWNHGAETMYGWAAEEVLGLDVREVIPTPEGSPRLRSAPTAGDALREEYAVFRKDGKLVPIETSYITMQNAAGQITGRVGVSRDITERVRAQERERQQMQRLLALREIDAAISSSFDQRFTLSMLLSGVTASLGVDAADVWLFNPIMGTLKFAAGHGFHSQSAPTEMPLTAHYSGDAVRERRLVAEPDLQEGIRLFTRQKMIEQERFRSYFAAPLIVKGETKGILEIFHRSPLAPNAEWLDFLQTLAGQAAIAVDNAQLFEGLQRSNFELGMAYDSTIEGWSRALDLRDKETEGHTQRVTALTVALARRLGFSDAEIVDVRRGGLLHDIGKMGVPDAILLKPGPLTDEEWAIMKKHPTFAYELLSPIRYLKAAALDIPYCHHERWDGSGYPRGLKGEQIPFSAQIFAVVDVWDALTSDRPYRAAWTREKAMDYIRAQSAIQFSPQVVDAFLLMLNNPDGMPRFPAE